MNIVLIINYSIMKNNYLMLVFNKINFNFYIYQNVLVFEVV